MRRAQAVNDANSAVPYPFVRLAIIGAFLLQALDERVVLGEAVAPVAFAVNAFSGTATDLGAGAGRRGQREGQDAEARRATQEFAPAWRRRQG